MGRSGGDGSETSHKALKEERREQQVKGTARSGLEAEHAWQGGQRKEPSIYTTLDLP